MSRMNSPEKGGDNVEDSSSLEKEQTDRVEYAPPKSNLSAEESEWLASIPTEEQRRIYHKVDIRLVPMLALLYLIAHLDRASQ